MKYHDSTPDCHNFQHPIPQPHQPSISACLIVKDEAATLDRCLASIAPVVDEIIVVDTGSTDSSVEIARRYTDKVFFYPWHDDFAAARNESLRHATGDWVMVIDADEWLKPDMHSVILAYLQQWQPKLDNPANHLPVLNARVRFPQGPAMYKRFLFPNQVGIQFRGRVHEIPVSDSQTLQYFTCHDLNVEHEHIAINRYQTKQAYYQALLEQSLRESEQNPELFGHLLKHLGDSYLAQGMGWQAKRAYTRFLNRFTSNSLSQTDPFVQQAIQRLEQLSHKMFHHWRKGLIAAGIGLLAACQVPVTPTVSITPPNSYSPVGEFAADFRIMYIGFCYGSEAIMADSCYNGGGSAIAGEQFTNDDGEVCIKYAGCVGGSLDGHGNNNGGSGGGSGCTTYDGSPCTFCPPGQALNEEGFCALPEEEICNPDAPLSPENILEPSELRPMADKVMQLSTPGTPGFQTQAVADDPLKVLAHTEQKLAKLQQQFAAQGYNVAPDLDYLPPELTGTVSNKVAKLREQYVEARTTRGEAITTLVAQLQSLDTQMNDFLNWSAGTGVPFEAKPSYDPPQNMEDYKAAFDEHQETFRILATADNTYTLLEAIEAYFQLQALQYNLLMAYMGGTLQGYEPPTEPVDYNLDRLESITTPHQLVKFVTKKLPSYRDLLNRRLTKLENDMTALYTESEALEQEITALEAEIGESILEEEGFQTQSWADKQLAYTHGGYITGGTGAIPHQSNMMPRTGLSSSTSRINSNLQRTQQTSLKLNQHVTRLQNRLDRLLEQIKVAPKAEKAGLQAQARTVRQEIQQSRRWQEESERHMRKAYTQKSKSQQKCEKDKNCDANRPEGVEKLSGYEIRLLEQKTGLNAHQIKRGILGDNAEVKLFDLYKDKNGDVYVVRHKTPPGSNFEPTGYNIKN